jgi:hypothetical protein
VGSREYLGLVGFDVRGVEDFGQSVGAGEVVKGDA